MASPHNPPLIHASTTMKVVGLGNKYNTKGI